MTLINDAAGCRDAGITYHLCPEEVWDRQKAGDEYTPEPFAQDGFIHCTNGLDELIKVGNMFYTDEHRPLTVLVLNVADISSPVRYDDEYETYPHIYGPLNTSAVVGQLDVQRNDDGTFQEFALREAE